MIFFGFPVFLRPVSRRIHGNAQMAVSCLCGDSSSGSPVNQSVHQKIGLIDVLQRSRVFSQAGRQRLQAYRTAGKLLDQSV